MWTIFTKLATAIVRQALSLLVIVAYASALPKTRMAPRDDEILTPKVLVISMFEPEANAWYENWPGSGLGSVQAIQIPLPGLSMRFPYVNCMADYSVCHVTTGESEINAAMTTSSLVLSGKFDLARTYFLLNGIAGVNPKHATLGSVALARYAVQVALQYEIDSREMPPDFPTGYLPYGAQSPSEYPTIIYGTEVFELNEALRDAAVELAQRAQLRDSPTSQAYRDRYGSYGLPFAAATEAPSVVKCDTTTSDVYYSGALLGETFENTTRSWTNGTGVYCMTAQEDNAVLEVLVRMAIQRFVDFGRIMMMRTGSNFDRPPPGVSTFQHLRQHDQNGVDIAVDNNSRAGIEIVKGILQNWSCRFQAGIAAPNYIGDIWGSLGGRPDFGPGSLTGGKGVQPIDGWRPKFIKSKRPLSAR